MTAYRAAPGETDAQILAKVYPGLDQTGLAERPAIRDALAAARSGVAFFPRDPPTAPGLAPLTPPPKMNGLAPPKTTSTDYTARAQSLATDMAAAIIEAQRAGADPATIRAMQASLDELNRTLQENLRPDPKLTEDRKRQQKQYGARQGELARAVRVAEALLRTVA